MFRLLPVCVVFLGCLPSLLVGRTVIEVRDLSEPQKPVLAKVSVSESKTRVADPVTLTLTIEGPAGLEVQIPEKILKAESALFWRVNPYPATKSIQGERIIWKYEFECAAFTEGDLPLSISPIPIRRPGEAEIVLEFPESLVVTARIKVAAPSLETLREPTEIERLVIESAAPQGNTLEFWLILLLPPLIGIPLAYGCWKRPKPTQKVEIRDRDWALKNLPPESLAEQAREILVRFLRWQSSERSDHVVSLIEGLKELTPEQRESLKRIHEQLEQERFDPIPKPESLGVSLLREFFESLPDSKGKEKSD